MRRQRRSKVGLLFLAVLVVLGAAGCTTVSTEPDQIAVTAPGTTGGK